MKLIFSVLAIGVAVGAAAACATNGLIQDIPDSGTPFEAGPPAETGPPPDASTPDTSTTDGAPQPTTYGDIADASLWQTFDTTIVNAQARGPAGTVFDGRYMYFVPYNPVTRGGLVTRFDTTASFVNAGAWRAFDLTTLDSDAKGYVGGSFDGRYVYFAHWHDGTASGGRVARYDTTASFTSALAWDLFDATTANAGSKGFIGTVFDGRYVYFVPYSNTTYDGLLTRYDTHSSFTAPSSWSAFDMTTVLPNAKGYLGATFDGRYIYFSPNYNGTGYHGLVARYDTTVSFTSMNAYASFDTTTVDPNAKGYYGTAFDGRYVYFVPYYNGAYDGVVTRYDTTGTFTDKSTWTSFDLTIVDPNAKGFIGAVFDGRYMTFVPYYNGTAYHGLVMRYDTLTSFVGPPSWRAFDVTALNPGAKGFFGGGFDGRYLYIANFFDGTQGDGIVARFDAKFPPSLPSSYRPALDGGAASFF